MRNMKNFYTFIFCDLSKIESHTGLKLHEGEEMMTTFTTLWIIPIIYVLYACMYAFIDLFIY